jgi:hypothetical protein
VSYKPNVPEWFREQHSFKRQAQRCPACGRFLRRDGFCVWCATNPKEPPRPVTRLKALLNAIRVYARKRSSRKQGHSKLITGLKVIVNASLWLIGALTAIVLLLLLGPPGWLLLLAMAWQSARTRRQTRQNQKRHPAE